MSFVVVEVFLDKSHISGIIEASRFSFNVFHLSFFLFHFSLFFRIFFIFSCIHLSFFICRALKTEKKIVAKFLL